MRCFSQAAFERCVGKLVVRDGVETTVTNKATNNWGQDCAWELSTQLNHKIITQFTASGGQLCRKMKTKNRFCCESIIVSWLSTMYPFVKPL